MRFYGNANGSTGSDSTVLIRQHADSIKFTAEPLQAERVNACTSRRMHVYRPRVTHCEKHGLLTSTLNGHFVTTVNAVGGRLKVVCEVREGQYHRQSNHDDTGLHSCTLVLATAFIVAREYSLSVWITPPHHQHHVCLSERNLLTLVAADCYRTSLRLRSRPCARCAAEAGCKLIVSRPFTAIPQ